MNTHSHIHYEGGYAKADLIEEHKMDEKKRKGDDRATG
jgi:hypothetical protein